MKFSVRSVVPYAVIIGFTLLTYGAALWNDYVWDDVFFLMDDNWPHDLRDAWEKSISPLFGQRAYVRPIPLFSIYLEAMLSARNPMLSHAVNLLIHTACGILVYLIASGTKTGNTQSKNKAGSWPALTLAVLFIVHPALTEAVIWISSRFDLTATLFMLLAIWASGIQLADWPRALLVSALFFLAALSKEHAAMLPAIIGAYTLLKGAHQTTDHVELRQAFTGRELKMYGSMFVTGLLYLAIRMQSLEGSNLLAHGNPSMQEHIARVGTSLSKYAQLTLIPFINNSPQHFFSWLPTSGLADHWPQILFSTVLIATITILCALKRTLGWWLLAWILGYIPVLHIVPIVIGNNLIHQRFMYLPTAVLLAFAPLAVKNVSFTAIGRKAALVLVALLVFLSILVCWSIVPVWKTNLSLWKWTVAAEPGAIEARENLIHAYLEAGMPDEALEEFNYIVENKLTTTANVALNMGALHHNNKEYETAIFYYDLAYAKMGSLPKIQQSRITSNLAITHAFLGQPQESMKYLKESLELNPSNPASLRSLILFCGQDRNSINAKFDKRDLDRAINSVQSFIDFVEREEDSQDLQSGKYCPYKQEASGNS